MTEKRDMMHNFPIFRAEAVQRYLQHREKAILPRFISPHIFIFLWILFGLFIISGFVLWFVKVPIYVSGSGVVVNKSSIPSYVQDGVILAVFLPSENYSRLRVGQNLYLQLTQGGNRLSTQIIAKEPEIISPKTAQQRFGLSAGGAQAIIKPTSVAFARFEPTQTGLPPSTYIGSVYQVDVEVGLCNLLSFVPLIGHFFGKINNEDNQDPERILQKNQCMG